MRFALSCLLAAGLVLGPSAALAQPQTDAQVAQALFDEARDLMDKHDYASACPLLERSQKLDPGGGTLLNLAVCWEGAGKLARANSAFEQALTEAQHDNRQDRVQIARAHLDALAPRLPRLRLTLGERAPGVVVQFDEFIEGAEVLGALTPVDPGPHRVRVSAQGRIPWEWSGTLAEGEKRELEVVLRPVPPPDPCVVNPASCEPPKPETEKKLATMSWVLGGTAVASLLASAITGGVALSAKSSFEANPCIASRSYCNDPVQGASDYDLMQATAWVSTITLGVAVVAAIAAIAWPRNVVPKQTGAAFVLRF